MKVCVTMVGVCRPTVERVIQNIESNISFFKTNYPQHSFKFKIFTYINNSYSQLNTYCLENNLEGIFIPHIEEAEFQFKPKNSNRYRLFYSMSKILETIPEGEYNCIIRLRLDSEVQQFELYESIHPTKYYTINDSGQCSDNIGYASLAVMKNVWSLKNCLEKGFNTESVLYSSIKKYNYNIKHFKFHFILYQSSDEIFDGVKQWSKRSREWKFDGKAYSNNDIVDP